MLERRARRRVAPRSRAIWGQTFGVGFGFEGGGRPLADVVRRGTASSSGSEGRGARGGRLLVAAARSPRGHLGSDPEAAMVSGEG
jgi:hypothetical protein